MIRVILLLSSLLAQTIAFGQRGVIRYYPGRDNPKHIEYTDDNAAFINMQLGDSLLIQELEVGVNGIKLAYYANVSDYTVAVFNAKKDSVFEMITYSINGTIVKYHTLKRKAQNSKCNLIRTHTWLDSMMYTGCGYEIYNTKISTTCYENGCPVRITEKDSETSKVVVTDNMANGNPMRISTYVDGQLELEILYTKSIEWIRKYDSEGEMISEKKVQLEP